MEAERSLKEKRKDDRIGHGSIVSSGHVSISFHERVFDSRRKKESGAEY